MRVGGGVQGVAIRTFRRASGCRSPSSQNRICTRAWQTRSTSCCCRRRCGRAFRLARSRCPRSSPPSFGSAAGSEARLGLDVLVLHRRPIGIELKPLLVAGLASCTAITVYHTIFFLGGGATAVGCRAPALSAPGVARSVSWWARRRCSRGCKAGMVIGVCHSSGEVLTFLAACGVPLRVRGEVAA